MDAYRKVLQGICFATIWLAADSVAQTTTGCISVDSPPAWNRLFDRHEGWTGGDGIFSIPLSGYKGPDRAAVSKTLFVFRDTWIGKVDPLTDKRNGATMIHNSFAVLDGAEPDPAKIRFVWKIDAQGRALSSITPNTPGTAGLDAWRAAG